MNATELTALSNALSRECSAATLKSLSTLLAEKSDTGSGVSVDVLALVVGAAEANRVPTFEEKLDAHLGGLLADAQAQEDAVRAGRQ